MGYGVTSTSILVASGTAAALSSASVHLAEIGTTLVSGLAHHRFGNVDWRGVRCMAVPGAIGAFLGATLLSSIPAETAVPWVAVFLGVMGIYVIVRGRSGKGLGDLVARRPHRRRFFLALGAGAGFLDAAGGGGWGPLGTSTLIAAGRMEPRRVIGTVSASEFLVSLGASAGFILALPWHNIDLRLVASLFIGGAIAAPFSAWLTHHLDRNTLGTAIGLFLVGTNLRTLAALAGARPSVLAFVSILLAVSWLALGLFVAFAVRRVRREQSLRPVTDPVD
jgi:hypothetical protein